MHELNTSVSDVFMHLNNQIMLNTTIVAVSVILIWILIMLTIGRNKYYGAKVNFFSMISGTVIVIFVALCSWGNMMYSNTMARHADQDAKIEQNDKNITEFKHTRSISLDYYLHHHNKKAVYAGQQAHEESKDLHKMRKYNHTHHKLPVYQPHWFNRI